MANPAAWAGSWALAPLLSIKTDRMKTVILKDTRSAEHVGCELVMENTLRACARGGLEVVGLRTTQDAKESLVHGLDGPRVPPFDGLLINGEGSMHHDRPVPTHLCHAARWARDNGKRVVLYNSLWQDNERLNEYLDAFDAIYCRDAQSAAAIERAGGKAQVVPDMVFASKFPEFRVVAPGARDADGAILPQPNEWVVVDSIDRRKSERLSKFAASHGYPFLHMDRIGYERLRKKLFIRTGGFFPGEALVTRFLKVLRSGQHVLSGRFHGTCLAMVLGIPVVSVASNTDKLQALHADVGLPEDLVLNSVPRRLSGIERVLVELEERQDKVSDFVSHASKRIDAMFDEIADLFR